MGRGGGQWAEVTSIGHHHENQTSSDDILPRSIRKRYFFLQRVYLFIGLSHMSEIILKGM